MKKELLLTAALTIGSAGIVTENAEAAPSWAKKGDTIVKCRGVAKKGGNDCGANGHDCAGEAKKDNDPKEWIYVPQGVCKKLAGGVVFKSKKIK